MKPLRALPRLRISSLYICSNCLHSVPGATGPAKHSYSTISSPPPPPPSAGFTHLPSRRLISLSGPDSTHYLQGVITANLSSSTSTPRTSGFYAAFLNAQGRLLNDVFIYPDPSGVGAGEGAKYTGEGIGGWLIEVDANEAERLAKHIKRYRLRAKFEVRVLEVGERGVWSCWDENGGNEEGEKEWIAHSLSSSRAGSSSADGQLGCLDARAPDMGQRLLLPADKKPEVDADESTEDAYRIRRYLKGVPEGQDELIREHALPQESNIDFMGGIDYRKGCYVGQELTIRTHHTGVVRKRVLPVMVYGKGDGMPEVLEYLGEGVDAAVIPRETSIGRVEKRGRSAGKWLRGVGNVGLGLCRLEIMTGLQVGGEVGGWKESDEFKLEWEVEGAGEEMVKVKAFVPSWHLKK